jgi:RNase P/RNase MRP subunit POP5
VVVKEKRGRKRYILFEHTKKVELKSIKAFLKQNSELINGKIRWRIINFENENSIILIDHTKSIITRELIEENSEKLGIKPIKTSGTLKALQK